MIGHKLTVQQSEPPDNQARHEPRQRDFGRISGTRKHALPAKSTANDKAIKSADQCLFTLFIDRPTFHTMGMTAVMKQAKGLFNIGIDPGFAAIARRFCANRYDIRKGSVRRNLETTGPDGFPQRA